MDHPIPSNNIVYIKKNQINACWSLTHLIIACLCDAMRPSNPTPRRECQCYHGDIFVPGYKKLPFWTLPWWWKHFSSYWPFVQGIHWSPVNSPHKVQWCGATMFSLICIWTSSWVNNRDACFETLSRSLWRHCNVGAANVWSMQHS